MAVGGSSSCSALVPKPNYLQIKTKMNTYKETQVLDDYLAELENEWEIYDDFKLTQIESFELRIHQIFNQAINALNQIS